MRGIAVEDYAKAIYKLQTETGRVSTSALAEKMGTSAAAVSKMLKHLARLNLAAYTPYYGVRLTEMGEQLALEVIRHHRLIEQYLAQAMGYTWDQVDAEAERLEHAISEDFEARIDALLGYPTTCPHGDPIPTPDGVLNEERMATLGEAPVGQTVTITRVKDTDAAVLRALTDRRMHLRAEVTVLERDSLDGLLTVRIGDRTHVIGTALAGSVFVQPSSRQEAA